MKRLLLSLLLIPSLAFSQQISSPPSSSSGLSLPGPKASGRFFGPMVTTTPAGAALNAANRLFATPVFIGATSTLKSLSFDISTGNAAAWNARMCVYSDAGTGLPGSLVVDTGSVAVASGSVTGVQTATLNSGNGVSLAGPGWYWLAFVADSASESLISLVTTQSYFQTTTLMGTSAVADAFAASSQVNGVFQPLTFGACPATFSTSPSYGDSRSFPLIVMGF